VAEVADPATDILPNLAAAQARPDLVCANSDAATRLEMCSRIIARPGATGWDLFGAHHARGQARLETGHYGGAVEDFSAAYRGHTHRVKGDHDRTIADFTKAIEFNQKDAAAYTNRGDAYYAKGHYDRAIADHTKAIELNPQFAEAYTNRGNAYRAKGDHDRAVNDFNLAHMLKRSESSSPPLFREPEWMRAWRASTVGSSISRQLKNMR
jgi:tetratricopeptide (TPR) repeat protein